MIKLFSRTWFYVQFYNSDHSNLCSATTEVRAQIDEIKKSLKSLRMSKHLSGMVGSDTRKFYDYHRRKLRILLNKKHILSKLAQSATV